MQNPLASPTLEAQHVSPHVLGFVFVSGWSSWWPGGWQWLVGWLCLASEGILKVFPYMTLVVPTLIGGWRWTEELCWISAPPVFSKDWESQVSGSALQNRVVGQDPAFPGLEKTQRDAVDNWDRTPWGLASPANILAEGLSICTYTHMN